ncbi:hypothetical protein [Citrobacter sp. wls716]|uniref:hypothetical protein n=1 Tax=Citrobacter sp. wls716 TaxID=2576420 RepID=UPI0026B00ADA
MSVKRYDMKEVYKGRMAVVETGAGAFVTHGDYAVLEQKLTDMAVQLANAESKCRELAADNEKAMESLKQADSAVKLAHEKFSALADENMALKSGHYNGMVLPETPATDAFLAEVLASAIPEGYTLVPQQIFLDASDIESICSQCGNGGENYGDYTDGILWVGDIQDDEGNITHGLHISSADYPEEGGVTICEFAAQLRKGAAL